MIATNDLYDELNVLLRMLDDGPRDVPQLMDDFYLHRFGNSAPGKLMRQQIAKLQSYLDDRKDW